MATSKKVLEKDFTVHSNGMQKAIEFLEKKGYKRYQTSLQKQGYDKENIYFKNGEKDASISRSSFSLYTAYYL